jgi:2-isopropylmalate synthase
VDQLYRRFLAVADRKREVFDEDLIAILHDEVQRPGAYLLESVRVESGTATVPTATVRLRVGDETWEGTATGDGPVDAICRAIGQVTGTGAMLLRYEIHAVTGGTEALGEAIVHIEVEGLKVMGRGTSTDVVEASAKAYIDGLNQLARRRGTASSAAM